MPRRLLVAAILAGVALAPASGETWRRMRLSASRQTALEAELHEAVRARWRKRLKDFAFGVEDLRVETDGTRFRLVGDGGWFELREGRLGDLPVTATARFSAFALDYAKVGIGRLDFLEPTWLMPRVRVTTEGLVKFIRKGKFEDVRVDYDTAREELFLAAARPIKVLFLRIRPRFEVRGRFHVDGHRLGVEVEGLKIRGLPRFVGAIVNRALRRKLAQRVDLEYEYRKLKKKGVKLAGGRVELLRDGEVLYGLDVPGPGDEPAPAGLALPPPFFPPRGE